MNIATLEKINAIDGFDWERWGTEVQKLHDDMTPEMERVARETVRELQGRDRKEIKRLTLDKITELRDTAQEKLLEDRFSV